MAWTEPMGCKRNQSRKVLSGKKRTAAARLAKLTQQLEEGGDAVTPALRRLIFQSEGVRTPPPAAPAGTLPLDGWLAGAPEISEDVVVALTGDAGQGEREPWSLHGSVCVRALPSLRGGQLPAGARWSDCGGVMAVGKGNAIVDVPSEVNRCMDGHYEFELDMYRGVDGECAGGASWREADVCVRRRLTQHAS